MWESQRDLTGLARTIGHRTNHAHQVPRSMLEFSDERRLELLMLSLGFLSEVQFSHSCHLVDAGPLLTSLLFDNWPKTANADP
jgi:hypothetical protein